MRLLSQPMQINKQAPHIRPLIQPTVQMSPCCCPLSAAPQGTAHSFEGTGICRVLCTATQVEAPSAPAC